MRISKDEVLKIASLSKLSLSDEEVSLFTEQLSGVISYVEQLAEVDTEAVDETSQVTGLENVFRDDTISQCDLQKELIDQAGEQDDGFVKAKSVF